MMIRKNDNVTVISGNAKGKTGKVLKVFPDRNRVIIEGVNIMKRHSRPSQKNPQGGIVQKEASIHVSNVMLIEPKTGEPTRVGTKLIKDETTGKKTRLRVSKATGETF
ncbi:MAG: 50S ribosomal protein L24 [Bacteroidetes bacterium]|nr:50S ribosomal protein L24 [Bacteroidota bacterium]MCW5896394.1 50S ribosomal protein L24 [Bacteroidota bacterium]